MQIKNVLLTYSILSVLSLWSSPASSGLPEQLEHLKQVYPDQIKSVSESYITWSDDTKMSVNSGNPSLFDQLMQDEYPTGKPVIPVGDPGRIRHEPFFLKMYGDSAKQVESKLTLIYWMPALFGKQYPVQVTTVNSVNKKLIQVSNQLEQLVKEHPEFTKYLANPGGFFNWRPIASTKRLSLHSFGMAIDINTKYSNYWQWDLKKRGLPVKESIALKYQNRIPWEIVRIFEQNGFIWGGRWYHYDTMHFEYRPEMFFLP